MTLQFRPPPENQGPTPTQAALAPITQAIGDVPALIFQHKRFKAQREDEMAARDRMKQESDRQAHNDEYMRAVARAKAQWELINAGADTVQTMPDGSTKTFPGVHGWEYKEDANGFPYYAKVDDSASSGVKRVMGSPGQREQTNILQSELSQHPDLYKHSPNLKVINDTQAAQSPNSATNIDKTFDQYQTAREGLMSALSGTKTGPLIGRLPAATSSQQLAEGAVSAMAPILKQMFRTAGEGTFTDKDQELLLNMVPTRKTNPAVIPQQMKLIDDIVRAKLGKTSMGAPTIHNDPLGIR